MIFLLTTCTLASTSEMFNRAVKFMTANTYKAVTAYGTATHGYMMNEITEI